MLGWTITVPKDQPNLIRAKQKDVLEAFEKWAYIVTGHGYKFDLEWYDNHLESDKMLSNELVFMECWHQWQYKYARIAINLSNLPYLHRLDWWVIHELVHMLMGEAKYDDISMDERACSEITSAILWAGNA